ncbi:MAG TPA: formate--tetrahydrofolate ligase [Gaiellaceae bacterium]|nr:formate--tetrahydrofolate ligase [Gaiellaceae bacterium]
MLEISQIADGAGLDPGEIELYGRDKAKIRLSVLERLASRPNGKLVAITGITPTKAGEGKTTTAVSLTEGLGFIGERSLVCLREPSVGPVLGAKGGGTGGGQAQVVPGDDINLHFTGDLHAIAAATNLLASAVDAHLIHGNELGIDPLNISWRRCLDIEDRLLRRTTIGVGEEEPFPRETGFDITAASEVMALMAMAADRDDVRQRLGAITIGMTYDGEPVTAEQLEVAGAMAVLLKDTLKPNLVQTVEGQPALIHAGPFANIAHGNSSLIADLVGLKLADYVVTEGGFGSDLGFEKFVHIVCRAGGLTPAAVVLVATVRALKRHGGDLDGGLPALERGAENLAAHLRVVKELGFDAVVAVNRFPDDSQPELDALAGLALEHGAFATAVNDGYARGGAGASELAEAVVGAAAGNARARFLYELEDSVETKLDVLARRVYGGKGVELSPAARQTLDRMPAPLHRLPICVAKTHLSLSHDPELLGAPSDFVLPVRELRPYTGAGWIVAVCGETQTMPGLPLHSAAETMDLDADGQIIGLI